MTREEIDMALATALAAPTIDYHPPPATGRPATLKALPGVNGTERREDAIRARQSAERALLSPRIEPKLRAALKAHPTPCALFLGPTGCGKTSAARWVMVAHPCHMVRARDLATAARRHGLGEGYPPEVERSRERGLLVIDDVGSEGTDVAALQDILDHRYSRGYPTLVTTGLTDLGLRAHLGAPYYRRIVDQHVPRGDGTEFRVLIVDCHEKEHA